MTLKHYPRIDGELNLGPDLELEAYEWVPDNVIMADGGFETVEPKWLELPQMSFMEFYQVRGAGAACWRELGLYLGFV